MTDFGECGACFNALERPFWDRYCFDCQDEMREEDEAERERLAEEDHFLYTIDGSVMR
jgi:hypothetical protein